MNTSSDSITGTVGTVRTLGSNLMQVLEREGSLRMRVERSTALALDQDVIVATSFFCSRV